MSKISGFAITATMFIEAKPTADDMVKAAAQMRAAVVELADLGFTEIEFRNRFVTRRAIPDEPKAAEARMPSFEVFVQGGQMAVGSGVATTAIMPDHPPFLKR